MSTLNYLEFYPTPDTLISKMLSGIDFRKVVTVLEPSAGKGNIADVIVRRLNSERYSQDSIDSVDCIEIEPDLRAMLKGKGYRVVHDDFLSFRTHKHYDLIVMNPPFSNGDQHLLHAIELAEQGGGVVCILNAETIRNPYTNTRKVLVQRLRELDAEITYLPGEFSDAERETDVEVALIKVHIPEPVRTSFIFEELRQKSYDEFAESDKGELITDDFIAEAVKQYNMEVEAGIRLIHEYIAMKPYIMESLRRNDVYNRPTLSLTLNTHQTYSPFKQLNDLTVNNYVAAVRYKYWEALFKNPKFVGKLTKNLQKDLMAKLESLVAFDFSLFNIRELRLEIMNQTVKGIEETIIELFDKLSAQHSWYPECQGNIHYFNGWATNKAHCINRKVIIPSYGAYSSYSFEKGEFNPSAAFEILCDLEKTLDYLNSGEVSADYDLEAMIKKFADNPKKIPLKYFYVTFYKKGTCHIEFTDLRLLERLNIFGSQRKGWLPPSYGKKRYADMSDAERAVIAEFQGEEAYSRIMENPKEYIIEPAQLMMLTSGSSEIESA